MATKLTIPFSVADDTDVGAVVAASTAAEATSNLAPGIYKIAAMGQPLLWKIGAVAVTNVTGSYLAAGDQEIIKVPGIPGGAAVALRFINSADASGDGSINIVKIRLYEIPAAYPENYTTPA